MNNDNNTTNNNIIIMKLVIMSEYIPYSNVKITLSELRNSKINTTF